MEHVALEGVWLLVGLGVAFLSGAFLAQYIKDKIKGVSSPLRTALQATETGALNEMKVAQQKVVNDVANIFAKASASAAAVPAVAAKPAAVAAAPATAVAAAAPVPAPAPAPVTVKPA